MRVLDNTYEALGQPLIPQKTIDFLQLAAIDADGIIAESIIGKLYDITKNYIMKGCVKSSIGGNTTISPGYIYIKPMIAGTVPSVAYLITNYGITFPNPTGGDVVICNIIPTLSFGDPLTFDDTSAHNIHNEYRAVFSTGPSGSGAFDYSDLLSAYGNWVDLVATGTNWSSALGSAKAKIKTDEVTLRGNFFTTGVYAATAIMTLPPEYWPSFDIVKICPYHTPIPSVVGKSIVISTGGVISFLIDEVAPVGSSERLYIDFSYPLF